MDQEVLLTFCSPLSSPKRMRVGQSPRGEWLELDDSRERDEARTFTMAGCFDTLDPYHGCFNVVPGLPGLLSGKSMSKPSPRRRSTSKGRRRHASSPIRASPWPETPPKCRAAPLPRHTKAERMLPGTATQAPPGDSNPLDMAPLTSTSTTFCAGSAEATVSVALMPTIAHLPAESESLPTSSRSVDSGFTEVNRRIHSSVGTQVETTNDAGPGRPSSCVAKDAQPQLARPSSPCRRNRQEGAPDRAQPSSPRSPRSLYLHAIKDVEQDRAVPRSPRNLVRQEDQEHPVDSRDTNSSRAKPEEWACSSSPSIGNLQARLEAYVRPARRPISFVVTVGVEDHSSPAPSSCATQVEPLESQGPPRLFDKPPSLPSSHGLAQPVCDVLSESEQEQASGMVTPPRPNKPESFDLLDEITPPSLFSGPLAPLNLTPIKGLGPAKLIKSPYQSLSKRSQTAL